MHQEELLARILLSVQEVDQLGAVRVGAEGVHDDDLRAQVVVAAVEFHALHAVAQLPARGAGGAVADDEDGVARILHQVG